MRALWCCLRQANWQTGTDSVGPKAEWKAGVKSKLDDLTHKEAFGKLSESEKRHAAYLVIRFVFYLL